MRVGNWYIKEDKKMFNFVFVNFLVVVVYNFFLSVFVDDILLCLFGLGIDS